MIKNRYEEKEYDIVVVGGGLSGVCAAVAAARHGAKTALIQARSVFGGNASSEIRMHICGASCHSAKKNLNETGILLEILLENKRRNPYHNFPIFDDIIWGLVRYQENLDSYLNTNMIQAECTDNTIQNITCYQSSTETTYVFRAPIFIDATGHGTLGATVGAEVRKGTESKYEFNEPSAPEKATYFTNGNTIMFQAVDRGVPVPFEKPEWAYSFTEEDLQYREHDSSITALAEGGKPIEVSERKDDDLPQFSAIDSGYWWIELGGDHEDLIKDDEVVRDELLKCVYGVWDHLKNYADHGAANYDLAWVGAVPGYRESRRLIGDYLLNENDIRTNKEFDDAVAFGGWPMDNHNVRGLRAKGEYPAQTYHFPGCYGIPYRCYYSKNINNLMMAGRDISVTKMAYGSIRVMATCAVGGQAVGTAAAMAVKKKCLPREIGGYIEELQQELLKDDCFIPGKKNLDVSDYARTATVKAGSHTQGNVPENVINGVARTVGNNSNVWESADLSSGNSKLKLSLKEKAVIKEIRITFDPDLSKEIMPSLTDKVRDRQVKGLPPQLVEEYTAKLFLEGKEVWSKEISNNGQRLNILTVSNVSADELQIEVKKTHGLDKARIFEVRMY